MTLATYNLYFILNSYKNFMELVLEQQAFENRGSELVNRWLNQ